ncbi:LOW QUALITY PROTEIN: squamosa promoter-binding-like protein 7 [Salvia miltiorrhiza]|uniref:LOW QUALITY PROTEIN: squamosa promoter-binding-like protein 7 n=1 Tax=Salvia miltiorrhiza TaxID=226208 RepID=UPI0025AD99B1|nr:LOW QUALITY PROTEIN: squamosa promoter-binding-like protein 7 [Salvia miltiorrhiza]
MQQNPSSHPTPIPPTEALIPADDPAASSLFDWSDFLDFNLDEGGLHAAPSLPQSEQEQEQPGGFDPGQEKPGAVRKRDPRLLCSNFLARVPCACPELDQKLAEEERELPGKKRTRIARGPGGPARCQVPGCEADISELKGYHRRHRVCLRCANAGSVLLDGDSKRYCQQCGKFHILSDFDEGKRSCRRKLERHNNRRRRKPNDSKEGAEKESQLIVLADDLSGDDDAGKDGISVNGQIEDKELLLESDGQVSALGSQTLQSDSVVSLSTSGEPHVEADTQNPKIKQSPPYCDNKSSFSSACPAGRVSFKLYDWNPAEFPRRLRLQIFQWLASMPVELEGYIRPGCTILTAFIAMPKPVWHELLEEPSLCIKDLVLSPGSLLSGRGPMHVYLNDMIFRITKDASLVHEVKVKDRAPKLHYIHPNCFEAGRPMEFVACGSHLLQPNFRFLISFAGQYLAYKIRVSSPCEKGDAESADHQLLKIYVPQIDIALSGPAFVEVENQSGLSNFIPVLVGDKETCAEMEILQQKSGTPSSSHEREHLSPQPACSVLASRQVEFNELVLDVAWLLKKPASDAKLTSSHILRSNCLLEYLMEKESTVVLEGLCRSLRSAIDNNLVDGDSNSNMRLLQKNIDAAQRRLAPRSHEKVVADTPAPSGDRCSHIPENDTSPFVPVMLIRVSVGTVRSLLGLVARPPSSLDEEDATVPLLKDKVIMNVDLQERPRGSCSRSLSTTLSTSRLLIVAVMAVGVCFGVCAAVLHPQRVGQITLTIHSCLFDISQR